MSAQAKPQKEKGKSVFDMLDLVDNASSVDGALRVPLSDIIPDPEQPRRVFDEEALNNLAASIKAMGILQPVAVKPTGAVPPYMLIAGERRWRAAQIAGLTEIPVFVRDDLAVDAATLELSQLVENLNRRDLSDLEMARAIYKLYEAMGKKHGAKRDISEMLDLKQDAISRLLSMLEPEWLPLVEAGLIVKADALARFRTCSTELREELLAEARATGVPITVLTVRQARTSANAVSTASAAGDPPATGTSSASAGEDLGMASAQGGGVDSAGAATGAGETSIASDTALSSGEGADSATAAGLESADATAGQLAGDVSNGADGFSDDDGQEGEEPGGDGWSGNEGTAAGAVAAGKASTPREKAVALKLTGESVEVLLRYLVDKSTDRMEVRLPADLAIAVIEKLGGQVPDSAERFSDEIRELLEKKLA